jgi:hypothetical protein
MFLEQKLPAGIANNPRKGTIMDTVGHEERIQTRPGASATTNAPPMTYEGIERLKPWLDQAARSGLNTIGMR